ncbi:stress-induced protein KIN2-like [Euphorbia lathyris]|uniref:stress-induced protein KIN2-like n=1 Tax=Euphorbia lathyris TaxID=212925 RepID=UPI003313608C
MSSNSQQMAFNAGEAKGQSQEKANTVMDKASNVAQSAKESVQEAGQQVKATAQGTVDAVKNATGINK